MTRAGLFFRRRVEIGQVPTHGVCCTSRERRGEGFFQLSGPFDIQCWMRVAVQMGDGDRVLGEKARIAEGETGLAAAAAAPALELG